MPTCAEHSADPPAERAAHERASELPTGQDAERGIDERAITANRSFVRREGRMTVARARALAEHGEGWVVPFSSGLLDLPAAFGRDQPLLVEIGFGAGEALIAGAAARPDWNVLGIEVYRSGIGAVINRARADHLDNIRLLDADAKEVLLHGLTPASVDELWLFFPDPWHKKRHHKRRIVQSAFAELVADRLKPGGLWRLATDWEPYAHHMRDVLEHAPAFANVAGPGAFATPPEERPTTRFEARGRRLGHGVWDLAYRRV